MIETSRVDTRTIQSSARARLLGSFSYHIKSSQLMRRDQGRHGGMAVTI
jgi:hypothetical protein